MSYMTPQQYRMARAALTLGVRDVASGTGVSTATITRAEKTGDLQVRTAEKIQAYFESKGVIFIPADETAGPGVRLKQTR